MSVELEASSSTPRPLCSICNHQYSIYTCPRCSTRTCSLPCSATHKSTSGCSGERDKVAYVPMNKYGWGAMMNDYVYLEELSRRSGDWGKEIVKGGFSSQPVRGRGGDGRVVRGRGRGNANSRDQGRGRTKRDLLKMQLELQDITMDLLPNGMERRKTNQSNWDPKYVLTQIHNEVFTNMSEQNTNRYTHNRVQIPPSPGCFRSFSSSTRTTHHFSRPPGESEHTASQYHTNTGYCSREL